MRSQPDKLAVLTTIDPNDLPDLMRRVLDPNAPPAAKDMAARGMIPAAPQDTLLLLYQLSLASDPKLRDTALATMADQPLDVVLATLASITHPGVLHRLAEVFDERILLERLIDHRAAHEDTIVAIANIADEELTQRISVNESRLLKSPQIIEALYLNPNTRMATVSRLVELAHRNDIVFENIQALNDLKSIAAEEPEEESEDYSEFLAESVREAEEESSDDTMAEARRRLAEAEAQEASEEPKKRGSRQAQIDRMSISEKTRLATLGSASDREYLIRNPNRMIHMAVVMSPKVRYADVYAWSANRSLPDGVINYIAGHRMYRKSYPILVNLANNPKTHLSEALRLLQSLQIGDLKAVTKNRNVKPQVARMAKNMLEQKEKARRR